MRNCGSSEVSEGGDALRTAALGSGATVFGRARRPLGRR